MKTGSGSVNRRNFLKMFGVGVAAAATPKLIFDYGKNAGLYTATWKNAVSPAYPGAITMAQINEIIELSNALPGLIPTDMALAMLEVGDYLDVGGRFCEKTASGFVAVPNYSLPFVGSIVELRPRG